MDSIIVVNKEIGYTSRDIVNLVEKRLNTKKVGHTGTLDPLATGVLVICCGKALKICELLTNHDKEYIAGVTLGIETDTIDLDGKIIRDENVYVTEDIIHSCVNSFKVTYMQEVPKYSAVKVNGRKLYEYARSNIDVPLPKKLVTIHEIEIIDDILYKDGKIYFKIKCSVSKGTYIRSLVRDIGQKLGVPAVMNSLVRTRQGIFTIENANSVDDIINGNIKTIDISDAFPDIKQIMVDDDLAFKVRNGVVIDNLFDEEMAFIIDNEGNLLALYKNERNKCRAYKMFI